MRKKIFVWMVVLQLGVFLGMYYTKAGIVKKGKEYSFYVEGYDPYDFMRGNYIRVTLKQKEITQDGPDYMDTDGYFVIDETKHNIEGEIEKVAMVASFQKEKPKNKEYIKGTVSYTMNGKYLIKNPFERYYVEGKKAKKMETDLIKKEKAILKVRIYKGRYIIDSIEI